MSGEPVADAAFAAAVERALAAPEDGPLAARFPAALVTAIAAAAGPGEEPRLQAALAATIATLESLGVTRGRQSVILAHGSAGAATVAPRLRAALGVPVLAHEPAGPVFLAGRERGGEPIELSDELREAESLVVVGPVGRGAASPCGAFILCPGLASSRTASAWAARLAREGEAAAGDFAADAERAAPVDLAVLWDERGKVVAGGGRERFAAFAAARRTRRAPTGAGSPETI
jgi:hypothetical protein